MKISFKHIIRRISGISTPVFGVSWHPNESERDVARELITFLEDRRVLYNPYYTEVPTHVTESFLEIRREITRLLHKLDDKSEAAASLRAMRAASRKFLDDTQRLIKEYPGFVDFMHNYNHILEFFTCLGEARGVFGIHIAQLCVKYGIELERNLATILPREDEDSLE
jgi:hypothetical protein